MTHLSPADRTEEELKGQQALLSTMFDQTTDAIVLMDADTGEIVNFNTSAHEQLGYRREEFACLSVADIQADLTDREISQKIPEVLNGRLIHLVTRHRHKSGAPRDADLTLKPVNVAGRTLISAVWRDITEQKQRERDLTHLARRHQLYTKLIQRFTRSEAGINGRAVAFAKQLTEQLAVSLGVSRVSVWRHEGITKQLICMDLFDTHHGGHTKGQVLEEDAFFPEIEAVKTHRYVDAHDPLTDPRTAGYIEPYLKPLGITSMLDCGIISAGRFRGMICFEYVNRPHHWEPDEITFGCQVADQMGMVLLTQDRLETAKALARNENYLKDAQALSHTGHWHMDITTGNILWSDEMYRIFGLKPGTPITGELFETRLHPEDRERVIAAWKSSRGGAPYEMTHRIVAGNQTKWVEVRGRIEVDDAGRLVDGRGVVQVVTVKL